MSAVTVAVASGSVTESHGECYVCFETVPIIRGLVCQFRHLLCANCAVEYSKTFTERKKLIEWKGTIPCAYRDAKNNECPSPPFTIDHISNLGNSMLTTNFIQGLLKQALATATGDSANATVTASASIGSMAAVASTSASSSTTSSVSLQPLTPAQFQDATRSALIQLQEGCLFLACPRCGMFWDDYSGCSALQCASSQCQQHFCAVCFHRSPNSQLSHHHVNSVHGGHYHHNKFLAHHQPARTEKVVLFLLSLHNPLVRRQVLIESKELLLQYGLQYQQLVEMLGQESKPAPIQLAAAAPTFQGANQFGNGLQVTANYLQQQPLPPIRIILWVDRRVESNRRLKEAAATAASIGSLPIRVVSMATAAEAVEWLLQHSRLLLMPQRLRIVTNHAEEGKTSEELCQRGVASPIIELLADTRSTVQLVIFCGYSLHSAQQFVRIMHQQKQMQQGQLYATDNSEQVHRFVTFAS